MVYTGTSVAYGEASVVTATGMNTAFGELAGLLGTIRDPELLCRIVLINLVD